MKKKNKLVVLLDVDDLVAECNGAALRRFNASNGTKYVLEDVVSWACETVKRYKHLFSDPTFVESQPLVPGAKNFVLALMDRGCEVIFVTSTECEQARRKWLNKNFPFVPKENKVFTSRKDLVEGDVLFDDAPHNIRQSRVRYPILMRKPWNRDVTGVMAVDGFDEALLYIDHILGTRVAEVNVSRPGTITCLVGPSGSGKTETILRVLEDERFCIPRIFTTADSPLPWYRKVSREEFGALKEANQFFESSAYAGERYGLSDAALIQAFNKAWNMILPIDLGGAFTLKKKLGDEFDVRTVFCERPKEMLVTEILRKPVTEKEKTLRILALDAEEKNASLCDFVLDTTDPNEAAEEIRRSIDGYSK